MAEQTVREWMQTNTKDQLIDIIIHLQNERDILLQSLQGEEE